jgi:hypothetical protein
MMMKEFSNFLLLPQRRKQKVGQKHFSLPETANFHHHKNLHESKHFFFQLTHLHKKRETGDG